MRKFKDINYSFSSDIKSIFQPKIDNIQKHTIWKEFQCDQLRLEFINDKAFLKTGYSKFPPFLNKESSNEEVIEYCLNNKDIEDPISLMNLIKEDKDFIELEKYELTDFALLDLIERAKLGQRFRNKAYLKRNLKAFNDALWIAGKFDDEGAKVYFIDDIIFAIPSKDYKPLPIASLVSTLEKELSSLYKNISFAGGYYCHEIMYVDYAINEPELINIYQRALGQVFFKPRLILRLVTSNLGFSGANLYPMLEYSNSPSSPTVKMNLGERIVLQHKGLASLDKFIENINDAFSLIENLPSELAKLNDIEIKHPIHCLINLADKCGIPAKYIAPIAENASNVFGSNSTNARQVYLLLSKVSNYAKTDKEQLKISEKIGKGIRILINSADDVDIPKIKWVSLSNIIVDEGQDIFNNIQNNDTSVEEQIGFSFAS